MILLDTDVLSLIHRKAQPAFDYIFEHLCREPPDRIVGTTIVSIEEQLRGWLSLIARSKSPDGQIHAYAQLLELLSNFQTIPVLPFDERASKEFSRLQKLRLRIGTMDQKIAAIAIANNALLVSRNLSDFSRVPGLSVSDWTRD